VTMTSMAKSEKVPSSFLFNATLRNPRSGHVASWWKKL